MNINPNPIRAFGHYTFIIASIAMIFMRLILAIKVLCGRDRSVALRQHLPFRLEPVEWTP